MKKLYLLALLFIVFGNAVYSQIFFSNGALVQINSGAIVITNGGTQVASNSTFVNQGTLTTTLNSTLPNPGDFTITGTSVVSGNGLYRIEQDWTNDATFTAGTSTVELYGNLQQFIGSTNGTVTTFNNLNLTGTGIGNDRKKSLLGVDARVSTTGILAINNRELETQTNSFIVLNPAVAAVTNTTTPGSEGFVSSLAPGTFSRETNVASAYLFPTGSSLGTLRYRPIEVTPSAAATNTYTVRMNNNDPNVDGFNRATNDGVPCILNDLFYHSIERSAGATSADIKMHYIPATDGSWVGMGHWRNSNTQWNDMSTMTLGTSGIFNTVTRPTWLFANPGHPYVLTNIRPATPVISCPTICENSSGNTFTLTGNASTYQWTLPGNGTITSGQGNDTITANWTTGTGYVYVYAVGGAGCNSLPDSCQPAVSPNPVAGFTTSASGTYGDNYAFTNSSSGGTTYFWDFGDGNSSTASDPTHQFGGAGTYTVQLTVTNAAGCIDTVSYTVVAGEGIFIPNVFSPNGDGANDMFEIRSSGLTEYLLTIYNRWGQLVYESSDQTQTWDGNAPNGNPCPDGTYFFVLKAISNTKDYSTTGTVTIMGAK